MSGWEILGWLIAGLIVGAIARLLVPGEQNFGIVMTVILGIVGALVGGFMYNLVAHGSLTGPAVYDAEKAWPGWLFAILGGVIVVWLFAAIAGRRRTYP